MRETQQAERRLSESLLQVRAVAEGYPALRASENFQALQAELADTEDQIQASRRIYNSNVRDYNTKVQVFPTRFVAVSTGFKPRRVLRDRCAVRARAGRGLLQLGSACGESGGGSWSWPSSSCSSPSWRAATGPTTASSPSRCSPSRAPGADVVRVTADGRRVPIELSWAGYSWSEMVRDRGLRYPWVRHHADAGLANQLAFLDAALDWVADNTPRDRETRYLEARVTSWHNDDPPEVEVLRSHVRGARGDRRSEAGRRARRAARSPGEHALARVAQVLIGPAVLDQPVAVPFRCARRADLQRRLLRALCRLVSGAAADAVRRVAAARGGGRGRDVARPGDARGDGDDVRDRHLQPLPVDHALPQQPGLSRDRPGAAGGGAARVQRPGWPLWLLRFECAAVYGASGLSKPRSRLVRRHGPLAAGRAGAGRPGALAGARLGGVDPHRPRLLHRAAKLIVLTELFIAVGLWRRAPATRRSGSPSSSTSRSRSRVGAGLLVPGDRRAGDLGGALHPRSDPPHRPHRFGPAAPGRAGAPARLARTVSRRAGAAGRAARAGGSGRDHVPRGARRRVRAEPPAADRVVRPAAATLPRAASGRSRRVSASRGDF